MTLLEEVCHQGRTLGFKNYLLPLVCSLCLEFVVLDRSTPDIKSQASLPGWTLNSGEEWEAHVNSFFNWYLITATEK